VKLLYAALDQQVPGTKGGSVHVRAVADGLAALGHEVHVLTARGPGGFPAGAVRWHEMGPPLGVRYARWLRAGRVEAIARAIGAEAVIERYHNFGGEGIRAAATLGVPSLLEVNAPVVDHPGSRKRLLDRLVLVEPMRRWRDWQCRTATLLVTPTAAILPPLVERAKVLEIEWGADTDRFRPGAGGPVAFARGEGDVVAVFAGAFRTWHGAGHLVEAIRTLRARGETRLKAVLIGDGPELKRVRRAASALDGVTFTGAIPHDEVPANLAAADIGVAPFDVAAHAPLALAFYWSPLKVFEYMAAGLPVVAPRLARLETIVGDLREGVLYDAGRPDALCDALAQLMDPGLRARLGAAARARVVGHFSWAAHCAHLDRALREACGCVS
jgi:glycosyltransferase involved in cell wall biosynthesis